MEVTVLGSGTGLPSLKRAYPGLCLNIAGENILVDCGPGTLRRLLEIGVTYNDINYILLSHLHPDHTLDLVSILFAAKNPFTPRMSELVLIGPNGLNDFYKKLSSIYGGVLVSTTYNLVLKEFKENKIDFLNWSLLSKPLPHTESSIGFRIETKEGRVISYSGDTDYCRNAVDLSRDADLAILECSFPDEAEVAGHLTPSKAARIAMEARCKYLILMHLYPVCEYHDMIAAC